MWGPSHPPHKSNMRTRFPQRLAAASVLFGAGALSTTAQSQIHALLGDAAGDQLGASLRPCGDVDGDGSEDFIAGAPGADAAGPDAGLARVFSGATGLVLHEFTGGSAGDRFGHSVAGAGDVDGDGVVDLIVGAPFDDAGGLEAGSATVLSGADGSVLQAFEGEELDQLGHSVDGFGDFNADGRADFVIGVPGEDLTQPVVNADFGAAVVRSGSDGSVLLLVTGGPSERLGHGVARGGDTDGDGKTDLLTLSVGAGMAPTASATVHSGVFGIQLLFFDGLSGPGLGVATAGDVDQDGRDDVLVVAGGTVRVHAGDGGGLIYRIPDLGQSGAAAGDVDADGVPDVIAGGAPYARVISGQTGRVAAAFQADGVGFGAAVGAVGDLDGDGRPDLLVGAPADPAGGGPDAGSVHALSAELRDPALFHLHGDAPEDEWGFAVAGLGDVDGDGTSDLLIGAPRSDAGALDGGAGFVISGRTGVRLLGLPGTGGGDQLGFAVAGSVDADGDGTADLLLGAPNLDQGGLVNRGALQVSSGASGAPLQLLLGDSAGDRLGWSAAGPGDLDGDGRGDFLAGIPGEDANGPNSGAVRLYSGQAGNVLFTVAGDQSGDALGFALAGVGDVDGDGTPDWIAGAHLADAGAPDAGLARVFSGATAAALFTFTGDAAGDQAGEAVAGAGDLDLDGTPDLLVGLPRADVGGAAGAGRARAYSGATGALLFELAGSEPGELLGLAVSGAGDADADGTADFAVGAPGHDLFGIDSGRALLVSGQSGAPLREFHGDDRDHALGRALAGPGDLDGDGFADLAAGAPQGTDLSALPTGTVRVLSGADRTLTALQHELSLAAGGTVRLEMRAGPAAQGALRLVLGSASGTSPGVPLGAVLVPLNPDGYTDLLLSNPAGSPLSDIVGVLDAAGASQSLFALPPGTNPALSGLTLHHAFLTITAGVDAASKPQPLTLVP